MGRRAEERAAKAAPNSVETVAASPAAPAPYVSELHNLEAVKPIYSGIRTLDLRKDAPAPMPDPNPDVRPAWDSKVMHDPNPDVRVIK